MPRTVEQIQFTPHMPKALRVAADVRANGIDGDLKGKRNIRGCFAPAAHDVQNLNFMFGHFKTSLV